MLTKNSELIGQNPEAARRGDAISKDVPFWTDDRSNLFEVLK